jgi:hypothetical protein
VEAVKRETNVNPNQSQVLLKCMLHLCVPFFYVHNIGERNELNILKLELTLFRMKCNFSTNSGQVKTYL